MTNEKAERSDILIAIHEMASDLHDAGTMDEQTFRRFNELCLEPVGLDDASRWLAARCED